MRTGIGIIFGLFIISFAAIVVEEVFLGGKLRRRAERLKKESINAADTGNRA